VSEHHLDIVRQVLDRQVVDANFVHCGRVDDLEITGKTKLKVTALLVGNGAASDRLPELLKAASKYLFGDKVTKIPWSEIKVIKDVIQLNSTAEELGLEERKGSAYRFISKLPGAWKK
jgi:sporulation protein YlmC with PRC-barrel domain